MIDFDGDDGVDLRSDTLTRPTPDMYGRMVSAKLGDDGLDHDPTACELEETTAALLRKDAGLFVPTCTMANLLAVLVQVQRSEQILLEASAHMINTERGAATLTGAFFLGLPGHDGALDLDRLDEALRPSASPLRTALVAVETTHNAAGGMVPSLSHMAAVADMARKAGIPVHCDGARLFNAAVHLGVDPATVAEPLDTISICLSKGLSAPVGAVLVGSARVIDAARRLRKMIGGTQRQVGVMAAAGLEALTTMVPRLAEDHARARELADGITALGSPLTAKTPQTNIVQVDISRTGRDAESWVADLDAAGLRVRPLGTSRLRLVTHRHIEPADIPRALTAFRRCLDGVA